MICVRFTQEEFTIMVDELLHRETVSFEMLCHIAEKTLRSKVNSWCKADDCLRGRDLENDLMQEILLLLMKKVTTSFLLHPSCGGQVNMNPAGFQAWLFRVADNCRKDFFREVRGVAFSTEPLEEMAGETEPPSIRMEREDELKSAFAIVLSADVSVYKVLTWVAHSVFLLQENTSKIQTNELVLDTFENKTLQEMYRMVREASEKISWMVITEAQDEKIRAALQEKWHDQRTYGQVQYREFFMKQSGMVSGKKSISDWMNRMNNMIQRKLDEIAHCRQQQAGHTLPGAVQGEAGRSEYAPSDS